MLYSSHCCRASLAAAALALTACQGSTTKSDSAGVMQSGGAVAMTPADMAAVTDTTKAIVNSVLDAAAHLDGQAYVKRFASSAMVADNGNAYTTALLQAMADSFYTNLSSLQPKVTDVHVTVLGPDAAAAQASFTFTMTTKAGKTANGEGIWSAVLKREAGTWAIVSSHESEKDNGAIMAALFPPTAKKK
jgi:uncharacterized protein (TIGR02246 family)